MQKRTNKLMVTLNDAAKATLSHILDANSTSSPITLKALTVTVTTSEDVEMVLEGFDDQAGNVTDSIAVSLMIRTGGFEINHLLAVLKSPAVEEMIRNQYDKITEGSVKSE